MKRTPGGAVCDTPWPPVCPGGGTGSAQWIGLPEDYSLMAMTYMQRVVFLYLDPIASRWSNPSSGVPGVAHPVPLVRLQEGGM